MTFEDELRREREEVSRTTRREDVIKFISIIHRVAPGMRKEEIIEYILQEYSEIDRDTINELYQEYIDQQYNQEE